MGLFDREGVVGVRTFEEFWKEYPRKVGRFKAEQLWDKLSPTEREDAILGVKLWRQTLQWQGNDGIYIPHGSTFLAQKRYYDEAWKGCFDEQTARR